jgi:hypothetical protein
MSNTQKKNCPNFPFFGASYPDAGCFDGELRDLDDCDENGAVYEHSEQMPCPFCRTEAFIKRYAESSGIKYKEARARAKALKEKYNQI